MRLAPFVFFAGYSAWFPAEKEARLRAEITAAYRACGVFCRWNSAAAEAIKSNCNK
jgi:hypothetical protein